MNTLRRDTRLNVRVADPVYRKLKSLSLKEDIKVAELVRRAISQAYNLPKK